MKVEDVKVIGTEEWKNNPPQYDNLTDNRTAEWDIAKELTDIKERFAVLTKLADDLNVQFVGGLQQGVIKDWEIVAQLLSQFEEEVKLRIEAISENFIKKGLTNSI